jgi:hypothetical protein
MPKVRQGQVLVEEKGPFMPPLPRIYFNKVELLPLVDDAWEPVKDKWVLPGCAVLTTDEVRALARARGVGYVIHKPIGDAA